MKNILRYFVELYAFFHLQAKKIENLPYVRIIFQIIIILACGYYLFKNFESINIKGLLTTSNVLMFLIAMGGFTVANYIVGFNWWMFLKALNWETAIFTTSQIHLKANLGKYLPGYGWQLVGKAYMSSKLHIPIKVVGIAMIVELSFIYFYGLMLACFLIPQKFLSSAFNYPGTVQAAIRIFTIVASLIFPLFARKILLAKIFCIHAELKIFYISSFVIVIGWLLNGFCFWLLTTTVGSLQIDMVGLSIFILITSFLLGILIFIVPGSFGVRESIMVLLISTLTPQINGVVLAILQRLLFVVSDYLSYVLITLVLNIKKRLSM